jgi:hypothetical protein
VKLDQEIEKWPRTVGPIIPPDAENPRLVPVFNEAHELLGWIIVIGPPFPVTLAVPLDGKGGS